MNNDNTQFINSDNELFVFGRNNYRQSNPASQTNPWTNITTPVSTDQLLIFDEEIKTTIELNSYYSQSATKEIQNHIQFHNSDISIDTDCQSSIIPLPSSGNIQTSYERWFKIKQKYISTFKKINNIKLYLSSTGTHSGINIYFKTQNTYSTPQNYNTQDWQQTNSFTLIPETVPTSANIVGELTIVGQYISDYFILVQELDSTYTPNSKLTLRIEFDEQNNVPLALFYLQTANDSAYSIGTTSTFGSLIGTEKWTGGVLANDGCIYGIPGASATILKIDPSTNDIYTFGSVGTGQYKWWGGVLARNGGIYCSPCHQSSVLKIDPTTDTSITFGSVGTSSYKWIGAVLSNNGSIYCMPYTQSVILKIDPNTDTTNTFGTVQGNYRFMSGTLATNNKIYGIPSYSSFVIEIDTDTDTITTFGTLGTTAAKYKGGVLAPNGKIYCIPFNATQFLEIDPENLTTYLFGNSYTSANKWSGGILATNGNIYGIPNSETRVVNLIPQEVTSVKLERCISAYYNKY